MPKNIPDSYSKREGGNPGNSGLSSQQKMVVHYPRTVWKNSYAEHEVTGKTYNLKKEKEYITIVLARFQITFEDQLEQKKAELDDMQHKVDVLEKKSKSNNLFLEVRDACVWC